MKEKRGAYSSLVEKHDGTRKIKRSRGRKDDNIKMGIQEINGVE
jgi:hypothetical protein